MQSVAGFFLFWGWDANFMLQIVNLRVRLKFQVRLS